MGNGKAVQHAEGSAVAERLVSRTRMGEGLVEGAGDDGVALRVERLDPRDVRRDDLPGRHLAAPEHPGERDRIEHARVSHRITPALVPHEHEGLETMLRKPSTRGFPGRSGMTSVRSSRTWAKPGGSPLGETSQAPSAAAVATRQKGGWRSH